jgi:hypothetical protein
VRAKLLAVHAAAGTLACLLVACRTQPPLEPERTGHVGAQIVETEGAERYRVDPGSFYDYPVPAPSNPMPAYPPDLLAAQLPPVRIRVRVIVSEAGLVSQVTPIDPSDAVHPRFIAAVQDAVLRWRYMPLVKVERGPVQTRIIAHGHETTYPGVATALPFHEDCEFTFTQRDGTGSASMSGTR